LKAVIQTAGWNVGAHAGGCTRLASAPAFER
jgi:hypothetical protein